MQTDRKPVDGVIRDVSLGGLSLHAAIQVDLGEVIQILIPPDQRRPEVYLEAIVWYVRAGRGRGTEKSPRVLGLVLSDAPNKYLDLLESLSPAAMPFMLRSSAEKTTRSQPAPADAESEPESPITIELDAPPEAAAPPCEKPEQLTLPKPQRFQIRVKMNAQPRTRSIMVFATSADEAQVVAVREAGDDWMVLEVEGRD